MAVMAPSLKGLQRLLDTCASYCEEWDIKINAKKTKNISFGKVNPPAHQLSLDGSKIPWADKCVYLGITLGKFYRSLNSIIRVEGRPDDMVMLRLLESHSLYPFLHMGLK